MTDKKLAVVVLAAGRSSRMLSDLPKVLHPLAGRPVLTHVLDALAGLAPVRIVVVVGPEMEAVAALAAPHPTVVQETQEGTAHAVLAAREALTGHRNQGEDVLIAFGDTPLVSGQTLEAMVAARREAPAPDLVIMSFQAADPEGYGRILLDEQGAPLAVVEERDATEDQRRITLCIGGLMIADGQVLFELLQRVDKNNLKGEYYLTDLPRLAQAAGYRVAMIEAPEEEVMGVNSRAELAVAEAVMQTRLREQAMAAGVTLIDPSSVWLSSDTRFGRDAVVAPSVFFGPGVSVGDRVEIRSFCHLEGVTIEADARIGPYARLRPGTVIGPEAQVGNFVEIKNATLAQGAKANHLSYIGDASVGERSNIGAGTITCNYDGFAKNRTEIAAGVFVGSNTALVAPVTVGAGAVIGAGSTIVDDVEADALAVARGQQQILKGGGARYRQKRRQAKDQTAKNLPPKQRQGRD